MTQGSSDTDRQELREFVARLAKDPENTARREAARRGDLESQQELTEDDIRRKIEELRQPDRVDVVGVLKRDWCASFDVVEVDEGTWAVSSPFVLPDGDGFAVLLKHTPTGWRLTDAGATASRAFAESTVTAQSEGRFR